VGSAVGLVAGFAVVAGLALGWPALPSAAILVAACQVVTRRPPTPLVLIAVAAALLGALRASTVHESRVPDAFATSTTARVEVASFPRSTEDGAMVVVNVLEMGDDEESMIQASFPVLITLTGNHDLVPGDALLVGWSPEQLSAVDPGFAGWMRSIGASALARVWWIDVTGTAPAPVHWLASARGEITTRLRNVLPGDAGALASGIVTGNDTSLSPAAQSAFLRTGTAHITAVSGSNIAMVLAIWYVLIPAGKLRRLLALRLLVIAGIWGYAAITGLEPPAVRAALMATLLICGSRSGRKPDPATTLALSGALMVLVNPGYVHSVSFWLSMVASMAFISRIPTTGARSWKVAARSSAEGVIAAQIWTLPIVLLVFGSWSLVGVIANIMLAPIMWLAFPFCFALAVGCMVVPWIAPLLAIPADVPLELALALVRDIADRSVQFSIAETGVVAAVGISVPCALAALVMSRDARRWAGLFAQRVLADRATATALAVGSVTGIAIAYVAIQAGKGWI
jgi:competence protein ComEC